MTVLDALHHNTFDSNSHTFSVRGAAWVEYWLQLDVIPTFTASFSPSHSVANAQILQESRCIGGAPVAARALWKWDFAAHLETAFGQDPNAKFARQAVENDLQEVAEKLQIPTLQLGNLSEREQPYRVHLYTSQNGVSSHARLEHGSCDETLHIQWQRGAEQRSLVWRDGNFWLDTELLAVEHQSVQDAPGGLQVLAAALCRAIIEGRTVNKALDWARTAVSCK